VTVRQALDRGRAAGEDAVRLSLPRSRSFAGLPPLPAGLPEGISLTLPSTSRTTEEAARRAADLEDEHRAVKAKLKTFESAYEKEHGSRPRTREAWGEMWPEYERYRVLRASMHTGNSSGDSQELPSPGASLEQAASTAARKGQMYSPSSPRRRRGTTIDL
jgi:hypothetical protein